MGLVEKYAPREISELLVDDSIKKELVAFIKARDPVHCLFHGPPGTGKTSAVNIIIRNWYGKSWPLFYMKVNGSNQRRIADMREIFEPFVTTGTAGTAEVKFKILHIDEADALTRETQDSLRVLMEDYKSNCVFILTTNHKEKINPAIISRCQTDLFFGPVPCKKLRGRLVEILEEYPNVKPTDPESFYPTFINLYKGDMRKIMSRLDVLVKVGERVSADLAITQASVTPFVKKIYSQMTTLDHRSDLYQFFRETGMDRREFLRVLYEHVTDFAYKPQVKGKIIKAIAECDLAIRDPTNDMIHLDAMAIKIREALQ